MKKLIKEALPMWKYCFYVMLASVAAITAISYTYAVIDIISGHIVSDF